MSSPLSGQRAPSSKVPKEAFLPRQPPANPAVSLSGAKRSHLPGLSRMEKQFSSSTGSFPETLRDGQCFAPTATHYSAPCMRASSGEKASRKARSAPARDPSRFPPPRREETAHQLAKREEDRSASRVSVGRGEGSEASSPAPPPFFQALTESRLPMPAPGSQGGNPER